MNLSSDYLDKGFYCEDEYGNFYGPYKTIKEARTVEHLYIWELKEINNNASKVNKIEIDFDSNTLTVDGGSLTILNKTLDTGTHTFASELWELVLSKSYEACDNVSVKGKPQIEGEYLNEMLHL